MFILNLACDKLTAAENVSNQQSSQSCHFTDTLHISKFFGSQNPQRYLQQQWTGAQNPFLLRLKGNRKSINVEKVSYVHPITLLHFASPPTKCYVPLTPALVCKTHHAAHTADCLPRSDHSHSISVQTTCLAATNNWSPQEQVSSVSHMFGCVMIKLREKQSSSEV